MGTNTKRRATHEDERYHVPNLERALAVIEYLDTHPEGRSMSEIAQTLGFPRNSVFRITMTLLKHGYLDRHDDGNRFGLSRKVLALGYRSATEGSLIESALEPMRQLRDVVRETVCLSILLDREGLVIEQVPGLHPFRFVAELGARQPAHASAAPKAMLAYLPPARLDALLENLALPRLTARTLTSKREYRKALAEIREHGYALDLGEHEEGVVCVGGPIFNRQGDPVAAITVTGPASRMPAQELARTGPLVRLHADAVSRRLGHAASS